MTEPDTLHTVRAFAITATVFLTAWAASAVLERCGVVGWETRCLYVGLGMVGVGLGMGMWLGNGRADKWDGK